MMNLRSVENARIALQLISSRSPKNPWPYWMMRAGSKSAASGHTDLGTCSVNGTQIVPLAAGFPSGPRWIRAIGSSASRYSGTSNLPSTRSANSSL